MSRAKKRWTQRLLFLAGFLLCCYPMISGLFQGKKQEKVIKSYEELVDNQIDQAIQEELAEARIYNDVLFQSKGYLIENETIQILNQEHYHKLLNLSGSGMMGSIEIPKINAYLPIYHGVEEDVLSGSIGHLEGSSLPVGGTNTRAVLTGHRGLPNAKLFTRLDEIEIGDLFYIHILDQTLAYQVAEIEVIEPEKVELLEIQPEKDLISLVTCTPYGINTHRLVVTGERVSFEQAQHDEIKPEIMSFRELFFLCVPFIFLGIGVIGCVKKRKDR